MTAAAGAATSEADRAVEAGWRTLSLVQVLPDNVWVLRLEALLAGKNNTICVNRIHNWQACC